MVESLTGILTFLNSIENFKRNSFRYTIKKQYSQSHVQTSYTSMTCIKLLAQSFVFRYVQYTSYILYMPVVTDSPRQPHILYGSPDDAAFQAMT